MLSQELKLARVSQQVSLCRYVGVYSTGVEVTAWNVTLMVRIIIRCHGMSRKDWSRTAEVASAWSWSNRSQCRMMTSKMPSQIPVAVRWREIYLAFWSVCELRSKRVANFYFNTTE